MQDPLLSEKTFVASKRKEGYVLRSGGTKGAGFNLPATWALYCLYF